MPLTTLGDFSTCDRLSRRRLVWPRQLPPFQPQEKRVPSDETTRLCLAPAAALRMTLLSTSATLTGCTCFCLLIGIPSWLHLLWHPFSTHFQLAIFLPHPSFRAIALFLTYLSQMHKGLPSAPQRACGNIPRKLKKQVLQYPPQRATMGRTARPVNARVDPSR